MAYEYYYVAERKVSAAKFASNGLQNYRDIEVNGYTNKLDPVFIVYQEEYNKLMTECHLDCTGRVIKLGDHVAFWAQSRIMGGVISRIDPVKGIQVTAKRKDRYSGSIYIIRKSLNHPRKLIVIDNQGEIINEY